MIRTLTFRADRVDQAARSVEAVIATEAPVAVYDPRSGGAVLESLDLDGLQVADQVPLLADHDRSIPSTLGSVADVRRDGAELLGRLRFASGSAAADEAWALVSQRHARAVSVGYQVAEHETLRPGQTSGRFTAPPDRPLKVARRWRLREVSLVPIGADDGALIRSAYQMRSELTMSRETLVESLGSRAVNQMTWPELGTAILRERSEALPDNDLDVCRAAFSSVEGVGVLTNIVNSAILAGYRSAPDSLAGIYRTVDLPNYLLTELAALDVLPRLERVGRGQVAPAAAWGVSGTGFRLARFGVQFVLDQMDFEDTARLSVFQTALIEVGAAVRRLVADLLFSVLLSNPTLGDGTPLFDAARGNLATGAGSALGATALDTAMTALAGQVAVDGDGAPVHLGLVPRYLIVAPGDALGGRTLARTVALGDGADLIVRADSRLGTAGVLNPSTGELVAGNGANWLLAAPADQAPGLVLGLLDGKAEPRVRHFELDRGRWGAGFDIALSVGAAAIDGKPLYWAVGQ